MEAREDTFPCYLNHHGCGCIICSKVVVTMKVVTKGEK
jgi:hypothetical protein